MQILDIINNFGLDPFLVNFLQKLGVSLMIGILIGIEREHWRTSKRVYAGVRTFTVTCLIGMLATFMQPYISFDILLITTIFMILSCILMIYAVNIVYGGSGLTSAIALFFTYLLGILVGSGIFLVPIVSAVVLTFVLIKKRPLHALAEHLSEKDISGALKFLAVVFVLYPIVPDEPVYNVLNLKSAILIVVLVSSISFVNYLSLKKMGLKGGIAYSGLLGGLVSSEATIVALANISRRRGNLTENIYTGCMLAGISMLIRNIIIALIVDTSGRTALLMLPPFLIMGLATVIFVLFEKQKMEVTQETLDIESPFALVPAFKFGLIFVIFLLLMDTVNTFAGPAGTYAAALGGIVNSAAVTASVTALALSGSISYNTAAETAVMAGIISTLTKPVFIKMTGSKELFSRSLVPFTLLVVIGVLALIGWSLFQHRLFFNW
ncbi:MgtC/SapB family protein [Methanomethylovorans sp.]|uniref:MgtC/SapB family protein n=1 Tax=Methanomethylovorans sp. TaxID=2758717 RepID=UPI000A6AA7DA|nr:MgtC/SapB family protein [Methanomethylovorans sp.]